MQCQHSEGLQEDRKLEARLGYLTRACLKKNNNKKTHTEAWRAVKICSINGVLLCGGTEGRGVA
jgi:hypothetical protein